MAVTTAIAIGGLAVYNTYSNIEQKQKADALQKQQEEKANALLAEQNQRDSVAQETERRDSARRRQRMLSKGSFGVRDTILTGASGISSGYEGQRKTLLGG